MFSFWNNTLHFVVNILIFIHSIRVGDFGLYREAIGNVLPLFFAFNHVHYARWLTVHLVDLLNLEISHPDLYQSFAKSNFTVQKLKKTFF